MALTCVKYDDGASHYITNGFPPRKKFSSKPKDTGSVDILLFGDDAKIFKLFRSDDGTEAWLLAYNAEQSKRLEAALESKSKSSKDARSRQIRAEKDGTSTNQQENVCVNDGKVLDGFFLVENIAVVLQRIRISSLMSPVSLVVLPGTHSATSLKHCCVKDPSDLCTVNISGQNLMEAVSADFELFCNVVVVNASDNLLPLEGFSSFSALQELEMPVNALRGLSVDGRHFLQLQKLDVSYNNLSPSDVLSLGSLKKLRELDITANNLASLPSDISSDVGCNSDRADKEAKFSSLEKLVADDNRFSCDDVFVALAALPCLSHLSLQKNELKSVPYLQLVEGQVSVTPDAARPRRPRSGRQSSLKSSRESSRCVSQQLHYVSRDTSVNGTPDVTQCDVTHTAAAAASSSAEDNDGVDTASTLDCDINKLNITDVREPAAAAAAADVPSDAAVFAAFPQLCHLNLAQNKISKEECVLATTGWPNFRELDIHDNPLTMSAHCQLPLITRLLQRKLGIQVHSKKPSSLSKPHIEMQMKPSRRVTNTVPVIPRCNVDELLLAIEAPPVKSAGQPDQQRSRSASAGTSLVKSSPLPPIQSQSSRTDDVDHTSTTLSPRPRARPSSSQVTGSTWSSPQHSGDGPPAESFFMTEPGGLTDEEEEQSETEADVPPAKEAFMSSDYVDDGAKTTTDRHVYDGYELLLDIDESVLDTYLPPPSDITSNVRALNYALSHPLVFTDTCMAPPTTRKKQPSFQPLTRKTDRRCVTNQRCVPGKRKTVKADLTSTSLGVQGSYTEAPLRGLLGKDHRSEEIIEAKKLLAQVQEKYRSACVVSVDATNQSLTTLGDETVKC